MSHNVNRTSTQRTNSGPRSPSISTQVRTRPAAAKTFLRDASKYMVHGTWLRYSWLKTEMGKKRGRRGEDGAALRRRRKCTRYHWFSEDARE